MPYPYEMVIEEFFTGDRIGNRTESRSYTGYNICIVKLIVYFRTKKRTPHTCSLRDD